MVAAAGVSESGQNDDTTATKPLQTSGLPHSGHRDIGHNNDTREHPTNTNPHPKSAPGVQQECAYSDPDLREVIAAWGNLPADVKRSVLHVVRSCRPADPGTRREAVRDALKQSHSDDGRTTGDTPDATDPPVSHLARPREWREMDLDQMIQFQTSHLARPREWRDGREPVQQRSLLKRSSCSGRKRGCVRQVESVA